MADTKLERLTTLGPRSMQTSQQDGQIYRSASVSEEIKQIIALQARGHMTGGNITNNSWLA